MHASFIPMLSGAALLFAASLPALAYGGAAQPDQPRSAVSIATSHPIVHRYEYHHAPRHYRGHRHRHARPQRRHFSHHPWGYGRHDLRRRHYGYYDRHRRGWPYFGGSSLFFLYRD